MRALALLLLVLLAGALVSVSPPRELAEAIDGVPGRAWLPDRPDLAAAPLVVYMHGHNGKAADLADWPQESSLRVALVAAGYVVVASDYDPPNHWGVPAVLGQTAKLVAHYRDRLGLRDARPFLLAQSMGGLAALDVVRQGELKPRALALIYPVCSLAAMLEGGYADSIAEAYGTRRPPSLEPPELGDLPVLAWASYRDTLVPRRQHTDRLRGAHLRVRDCEGNHGHPSHFRPDELVAFFEAVRLGKLW